MATTKSDPANRGKKSEKSVKDILEQLEKDQLHFCFNRNLDAHAAGGRFPAQAGDYQAFRQVVEDINHPLAPARQLSRNFIVEVKEVKHDRLLPHKNYSTDKVARVYKRTLAGTEAIVIVKHTTSGLWRAVPFEFFRTREKGSWDLSAFPFVDPDTALKQFFGYLP